MNLGLCVLIDYIFRLSLFLCVFSNLIIKVQSSLFLFFSNVNRHSKKMQKIVPTVFIDLQGGYSWGYGVTR